MIVTRTPFRVSLFGGGSDYPGWYRLHGGRVIGFAIDKYCYISLRRLPPFFEHKHRIVYSAMENVKEIAEIKHPAVRAIFGEMKFKHGLELHHDADLPARSGLGSSSAFTVGLLNALYALEGRRVSSSTLADEAIRIEQDVIQENVGSQDQIWAAYGGFNRIDFSTDGTYSVNPVIASVERRQALQDHCQLYYSGISRFASEIAAHQIANLHNRVSNIERMTAMVDEAEDIISDPVRDITDIGRLLHDSWLLKRDLSDKVSTAAINEIYEAALDAGALGGKLLGAGGGGFILLFVPPDRQETVQKRLHKLIKVPCGIAKQGSQVMIYEPDEFGSVDASN